MPRFLTIDGHTIISTSYKVMYSSLHQSNALREISEREALQRLRNQISEPPRHIILVRDPYEKFKSFFRDKLRYDLQDKHKSSFQWCQRFILWELGVSPFARFEAKLAVLQELTFSETIELLPRIIHNGHLKPQISLLQACGYQLPNSNSLLRVEDDLSPLEAFLDLTRRENSTTEASVEPLFYPKKLLPLFNALYHKDFETFGYEQRT